MDLPRTTSAILHGEEEFAQLRVARTTQNYIVSANCANVNPKRSISSDATDVERAQTVTNWVECTGSPLIAF